MVGKHIYSHLPLQTWKHIYGHLPLQSTQSSYIDYSPIGYIHQFFGRASIFFVFAMLISLKIEHYIYIYIIHEQKIKVRLMGNWFTIFFFLSCMLLEFQPFSPSADYVICWFKYVKSVVFIKKILFLKISVERGRLFEKHCRKNFCQNPNSLD